MTTDPKAILAEFGIDLEGMDPAGQYQWKMLSLNANSEDRKRLEKAWAAYVLDRNHVDASVRAKNDPGEPASAAVPAAPGILGWFKKRWIVIGLAVIGIALLWLVLHDVAGHRSKGNADAQSQGKAAASEWRTKYEGVKSMLDESAHTDEHHDEFILLAEAAKAAITGGQGTQMLEQINADLAAERAAGSMQRITVLAAHTVGSSRVDLQACKLEYSIVSPK